jgi:hypothetical protein
MVAINISMETSVSVGHKIAIRLHNDEWDLGWFVSLLVRHIIVTDILKERLGRLRMFCSRLLETNAGSRRPQHLQNPSHWAS